MAGELVMRSGGRYGQSSWNGLRVSMSVPCVNAQLSPQCFNDQGPWMASLQVSVGLQLQPPIAAAHRDGSSIDRTLWEYWTLKAKFNS